LTFGFFIPLQTQRSQALHILDDSRTASSFLLQCIIDFRFAPLIAFKYTFGNFSVLRVGLEILSVVARCSLLLALISSRARSLSDREQQLTLILHGASCLVVVVSCLLPLAARRLALPAFLIFLCSTTPAPKILRSIGRG
jgi:hypothetical protein